MPVSETLKAYIIIGYFGFKETNFRWNNIANNLRIIKNIVIFTSFFLFQKAANKLRVVNGKCETV